MGARTLPLHLVLVLTLALLAGCAKYEAPPTASLLGAEGNVLTDRASPIQIGFTEPIDPATLQISIAVDARDVEGNLPDEGSGGTLDRRFAWQGASTTATGGTGALDAAGQIFTAALAKPLRIGELYVIVIEPGLADLSGNATTYRQHLPFSYRLACSGTGSKLFPAHTLLFMASDVQQPIGTQIRLFVDMKVDPVTGSYIGRFTNASRNRDPSRCTPACPGTDACRVFPGPPRCVLPSERAGTVDEFGDYLPKPESESDPTGFDFDAAGCVEDTGGGEAAFRNVPAELIVKSPPVTIHGALMNLGFSPDSAGVLRGQGTFTADDVALGTVNPISSGPGKGTIAARSLTEADLPAPIPAAPGEPPALDAGTR